MLSYIKCKNTFLFSRTIFAYQKMGERLCNQFHDDFPLGFDDHYVVMKDKEKRELLQKLKEALDGHYTTS